MNTCHGCSQPLEPLAQTRQYHTSCDPQGRVEMLERALRKAIDFAWTGHGLPDQLRELETVLAYRPAQMKGVTMSGRKIIEGLQGAVNGNLSRVYIDGETWVRQDAGSPEALLATSRLKIAELTERVDVLEAEVAAANALIHAVTPPLTDSDIADATAEAIRIRPLIEAERKTEGRE